MRLTRLALTAAFALLASAAQAESVYTDLDLEACDVVETYEGGGADLRCDGLDGWDVWVHEGDARTDVDYGYWNDTFETFSAFNHAGPRIEWRIVTEGAVARPFAAIRRWFVSTDPENSGRTTQVLVVSRVGQVEDREGCVVGLVVASGNPQANEQARRIADEHARSFACGVDSRDAVGEGLPEFSRSE